MQLSLGANWLKVSVGPEQVVCLCPLTQHWEALGVQGWLQGQRPRAVALLTKPHFPCHFMGCCEDVRRCGGQSWALGGVSGGGARQQLVPLSPEPQLGAWRHLLPHSGSGSWWVSGEAVGPLSFWGVQGGSLRGLWAPRSTGATSDLDPLRS